MKLVAGKTKGKFVNVNALSSEKLRDELLNETLQFLGTEHGAAVREVYPAIAAPVYGNFSVAGISGADNAEITLLFGFGDKVEKRVKVQLDAKKAASQGNIYKIWAQKKIAELDLDYERNRAELTELGRQFGIVTRNTSLIVLETIDDYVLYDIEPPASEPELRMEYQRRQQEREPEWQPEGSDGIIARILRMFGGFFLECGPHRYTVATDFFEALPEERTARLMTESVDATLEEKKEEADESVSGPTITLKPIKRDNDYLKKLTGKAAGDYQIYLKLRDDYAGSPAFYFDMASWFYSLGDRETALRVLTSIADLELENASMFRLLGYRFKEYGEYALEKFVCGKVIQWRPMEAQSYRDYALALADNGEAQAALDSLWSLLAENNTGSRGIWEIKEVVITEMNHLIAKNPGLNTSKINKRMISNVPVDIRVVINWNMDNTDIDLHVKDPNGEECYYNHRRTKIGGRISPDNTSGYGPEQFILEKAVKGKYQVYVNYYGDRQFTSAGPSTIMAEIYTKYASEAEQRKVVTLQMSNANKISEEYVEVAEFSF
jgi:tetratricopeptide (TPR) repeat protein